MGHTLLSVLGLFLLNTNLYCGYTQEVVLTLKPNRSSFFSGEIVNFTIEMKVAMGNLNYSIHRKDEQVVSCGIKKSCSLRIQKNHSGEYWATDHHQSTNVIKKLSNKVNLTVLDQPKPVLTVSPSWLSPGASVTLNCEVEHPSAGWRFYWYKAVPKLPGDSYSYELLPGSSSGTEQDSYMVHGQTHTAGYVCRAGRGDPVFYTLYSPTRFAWSGDVHSGSASVKVSPDRVKHFSTDLMSLSCEGNSNDWRVKRFFKKSLSKCNDWGTMTGSTCKINQLTVKTAVYWCESLPHHYSNAVNITGQVSRPGVSSFLVPLITGLVCGLFLIILLMLLFCYKKSKGWEPTRSQSTNQSPAMDHMINQQEAQHEYASVNDDTCLYESVKSPEGAENDEPSEVTYSLIKLKNVAKKEKTNEAEESCVYSEVKTGSAADDNQLYAQIRSHNKAKAKKKKRKPSPEDETV